jgi:hypothetical protein
MTLSAIYAKVSHGERITPAEGLFVLKHAELLDMAVATIATAK